MKIVIFLLCTAIAGAGFAMAEEEEEEELQCNIKICGLDLLNFRNFNFGMLIKKFQRVSFCIKNCSPPIVHELIESIRFAVTKRIPGKCKGVDECVDHNRFIALGKCSHQYAWPLFQCGKMLFDLVQVPLEPVDPVNTTCGIVIETTTCIEETLQPCGQRTLGLVREIMEKPLYIFLNAYCRAPHREKAKDLLTTSFPIMDLRDEVIINERRRNVIPAAKALKSTDPDSSHRISTSIFLVLTCTMAVVLSTLFLK